MTRLVRLMLGIALVSAAACSGTPTSPPVANTISRNVEPLFECVGGWDVVNGVAC